MEEQRLQDSTTGTGTFCERYSRVVHAQHRQQAHSFSQQEVCEQATTCLLFRDSEKDPLATLLHIQAGSYSRTLCNCAAFFTEEEQGTSNLVRKFLVSFSAL